jgi:hypothetical protein
MVPDDRAEFANNISCCRYPYDFFEDQPSLRITSTSRLKVDLSMCSRRQGRRFRR